MRTSARAASLTGRYEQRLGGLECAIGAGNAGRSDDALRLAAQHDLGLPASETTTGNFPFGVDPRPGVVGPGPRARLLKGFVPLPSNDGRPASEALPAQTFSELRERFGAASWETQTVRGEWEDTPA